MQIKIERGRDEDRYIEMKRNIDRFT